MELVESYKIVKKSIVAITLKYVPHYDKQSMPTDFPPILGTGFIVNENGLIVTNDHILDAISKLWRPPGAEKDWGVFATLFHMTPEGQVKIPLEIIGAGKIDTFAPGGAYYGPKKPDLAFMHVKARGLPSLKISDCSIEEGIELATAGYPMGTDALRAPGWLHQITPTLQSGIVSAVLPYPCEAPHAFTINVMAQGGASGSPVFYPDSGAVAGILYGGLLDSHQVDSHQVPTNISYVVPSHYINHLIKEMLENPEFKNSVDKMTIDEMIASNKPVDVLKNGRQARMIKLDTSKKEDENELKS